MMKQGKRNFISNDSGFVTADFVFSFMLASMLTTFLFAMCFTFTIIEITQYISYSATRAAIPGHKSYNEQRARAQRKVDAMLANPELVPLLQNGWYEITLKDMRLGQNATDYYESEYDMVSVGADFYVPAAGVRMDLRAKILDLNLGPLGKIESESGNGFNLTLGSLIFREPSQQECTTLIRNRYQQIIQLDGKYGSLPGNNAGAYVPMEDNGC